MNTSGIGGNSNNYPIQNMYQSRPDYVNKGTFKNDDLPGINKKFGFGDIIYTMAQMGKASGACGGNFMAIA